MYNSEAVHGKWHFYGETLSGNWDVTSLGCIQYQQYPQTKTPTNTQLPTLNPFARLTAGTCDLAAAEDNC